MCFMKLLFFIFKANEVKMKEISKYSYELGELNLILHTCMKRRRKE